MAEAVSLFLECRGLVQPSVPEAECRESLEDSVAQALSLVSECRELAEASVAEAVSLVLKHHVHAHAVSAHVEHLHWHWTASLALG